MAVHLVITFPTPEEVVVDLDARNKYLLEAKDENLYCCGGVSPPYLVTLHSESSPSAD